MSQRLGIFRGQRDGIDRSGKNRTDQPSSNANIYPPYGVKVLAEGSDPCVDIIAVHGLNGHREATWAMGDTNWLRDFLPDRIPQARILCWGYDARTHDTSPISQQHLYDHARTLVSDLCRKRKTTKSVDRPIIFVAHSLGGIIVKSALIHSDAARRGALEEHKSIRLSTYGIIFMGTPHQGGNGVQMAQVMINITSIFVSTNDEILKHLRDNSEWLQQNLGQYAPISGHFKTIFAYETLKTPTLAGSTIMVVPKSSAIIPGMADAEPIAIHADHRNMVKFASTEDPGYETISEELVFMISDAPPNVRRVWDEHQRINALTSRKHDPSVPFTSGAIAEKDQQCLKDLRITDPRDDKTRIEATKGGLLRDSYRWVLDNVDFRRWRDDERSRLLWVKGDPGKGKTMLLCGIIDELGKSAAQCACVSFFFCQATDSSISSATAVVRGLIYSLLKQQPPLISHVRERYDDTGKRLFEDANAWFALSGILADILGDPMLETTYLIIDALDECISDLNKLLVLIVKQVSASARVKWVVSSRNWSSIEQQLIQAEYAGGTNLSLELNAESVAQAVDSYIAYKVSKINSIADNTALQKQVQELVRQKAEGTFLWVALAMNELLEDEEYEDDSEILSIIDKIPSGLPELYLRMLQQIENLNGRDAQRCKDVLSAVAVAYRPLSIEELPTVAGLKGNLAKAQPIKRLVSKCGSFLTCRGGVVYFVHQSAQDYLTQNEEALATVFSNGIADIHYSVFSRSLKAMNAPDILKQDIYSLTYSGTMTDEVDTPEPDPLAPVRYSCVYWVNHLLSCNPANNTNNDLQEGGSVDKFLRQYYLHWLEALGWMGKISDGIHAISALELFVSPRDCSSLSSFLHDAKRFVLYSRRAIEQAPLQLYSSALIFAPTLSIVRENFKRYIPTWIRVLPKVEEKWNAVLQTLEGHSGSVTAVAFSPDGKTLASASGDKTVKLWDAGSGAELQTLEGHSRSVRAVAFSPDGKTLASASDDRTVKLWDAGSGAELQTLEGQSSWVSAVAFSPDGKTLASASPDGTVKLWDAGSGAELQTLEGHKSSVNAVAFSPDGKTLASASGDRTVKLWDAGSGAVLQTLDVDGVVYDLSFSDDGTHLQTNRGILPILSLSSIGPSVPHQRLFPAIFVKDQWVYSRNGPILWLPPEYRTDCVAVYGNTAGFGYKSGRVIVIELAL